jgi:hypothetical protein
MQIFNTTLLFFIIPIDLQETNPSANKKAVLPIKTPTGLNQRLYGD